MSIKNKWDVIRNPLRNSIIFQRGRWTTNQSCFSPHSPTVFFAYLGLKIGYTKLSKPNKHIEKESTMKPVANVFSCFRCLGVINGYYTIHRQNGTKHDKTISPKEFFATHITKVRVSGCRDSTHHSGSILRTKYRSKLLRLFWAHFFYTQTFDGFFGLKTMKNSFSSWLVVVWNMTFHSVDPNWRVNHIFFRGGPGLKPPSRWLFTIINHIISININH